MMGQKVDSDTFSDLQNPRGRWWLLATLMIGSMAAVMSSTIMNVGIPDMSRYFTLGQERAQWVSSSFMVAMTVSMLCTPWLLARFGYRRTFSGCMILLAVAGSAGGFAHSFNGVLIARIFEGFAAGVVQPIPAIVILHVFKDREQGRANGFFGMGVVLAPAIGPSIGGLLVDWFGWRSLFFMVLPFCVASLWLARTHVPKALPGAQDVSTDSPKLDLLGLALATLGTMCLLNGLIDIHAANYWQAAALIGASFMCLGLFLRWQKHLLAHGGHALIHLSLFENRAYRMGTIVAIIYGTALFGSTYLIPVFLQLGLGLSPSHVGTLMMPAGFILAITIAIVGRYSSTHPTHWLVSSGLIMLASSFALMVVIQLDTGLWVLVLLAILGRIGLGFILPSLNIGSMRSLQPEQIAQGASTINFLRMLGGACGVSLCGIVLEWRLTAHGDTLTNPSVSLERLAAFDEVFIGLGLLCALAIWAAWQIRNTASSNDS
jgi:EmrB/QacA subfamily drug resistance transporter